MEGNSPYGNAITGEFFDGGNAANPFQEQNFLSEKDLADF